MIKSMLLLILTLILCISTTQNYSLAQMTCQEAKNDEARKETIKEIDNTQLTISLEDKFRKTKCETTFADVEGIDVYTIKKNRQSPYFVGYSLGKAIVLNNPDYPKDLKEFLQRARKTQIAYQPDRILEMISNSLPCSIALEARGLADALSINKDNIKFKYREIIALNTLVLWTKLPKKSPQAPPAAPTSVTPIKNTDILNKELTPVTEVSDQRSFSIVLKPPLIDTNGPIQARTYARHYYDFFNKYPAIMIYHMEDGSFMNVGFAGLITTISGMNSHGVSISTIQKANQTEIEVIGVTPPTVAARIALETSLNAKEAMTYFNNDISAIDQTYLIVDPESVYKIKTTPSEASKDNLVTIVDTNKTTLSNYVDITKFKSAIDQVNKIKSLDKSYTLNEIFDMFSTLPFYTIAPNTSLSGNNSVFSVIMLPKEKYMWVLMPTRNFSFGDNKFIKIGFDEIIPECK